MIDDKLLKTLSDIGFMASATGLPKNAFAIFNAIETTRPDSTVASIGFAMEFMNRKRHQEALDVLHKALKANPDDPDVLAFIGMSLMLAGRNKESEDYLTPLLTSDDPEAATMAKELLNNIHTI
ncbi:hypothetical protein ACH42_07475 [Endozoicomonas sp. (ex Bugula neritina AB1)]|nr:hypothetical protein ACH42_07475 [Endozoicomonas sp. (ex Bugula neritina AB1)]